MNLSRWRGTGVGAASPLVVGLAIQAVSTYAVLIIAGRALGASRFSGLSALYVLVTSVATGLFLPFEQEMARRRGDERGGRGIDTGLLRRSIRLALAISAVAIGLALIEHRFISRLLGENSMLLVALCVALPGYACCFVLRGEFAGRRQLSRYGVQLSIEGLVRLVGAVLLVVVGVDQVSGYGWLFAAAPWVALGLSLHGWHHIRDDVVPGSTSTGGPRHSPLLGPAVLLMAGCLSSQLLINSGPLIVSLFARPDDREDVGVFLAALVIVRVPVFLFTAVQPSFLPAMAEHAAADRRADFIRLARRVMIGCTVLVVVSAMAAVAIGPYVVRLLFGFRHELSRGIFLEMTLSVGLFLVAAILAQSLLGRAAHTSTTIGWLSGLAALAVGVTLGHSPVLRASNGLLIGATAATVVFGALLLRSLRTWPTPTGFEVGGPESLS